MGTTRTLNSHWGGTGRSGRENFLHIEGTGPGNYLWRWTEEYIYAYQTKFSEKYSAEWKAPFTYASSLLSETPGTGKSLSKNNASVNSTCAQAPPGQLRGICPPCQSRGWGICKCCTARPPGQRGEVNPGGICPHVYPSDRRINNLNYLILKRLWKIAKKLSSLSLKTKVDLDVCRRQCSNLY